MTLTMEQAAENWATLNVLSEAHCIELLRKNRWGRLAAALEGWPAILPVNYGFDRDHIVIKTGAGSKLAETPMTPVAFEIDAADHDGAWGWSVLVQGPAFDITTAADDVSVHLRSIPLKTWAPGRKDHWIRIGAMRISGRSFGVVPGWDNGQWSHASSSEASKG
ncbi:MAG: pyridoxamine 5'-phosphate oxidase family protein [Acidimicrobiales bacterium]|nr:pyridoxamine 5'-phosphate oxidase family protein [Acidimicrobiales bacterium]